MLESHGKISFLKFDPFNQQIEGFTTVSLTNLPKMKNLISEFAKSEAVQTEIGHIYNFKIWLSEFRIEQITEKALCELLNLLSVSQEREKIAIIDLLRLLMQHVASAKLILQNWSISIQQHIITFICDNWAQNHENQLFQNTHLISLKFLSNLYLTHAGTEFAHINLTKNMFENLLRCSINSPNQKVRLTGSVLALNHVVSSQGINSQTLSSDTN